MKWDYANNLKPNSLYFSYVSQPQLCIIAAYVLSLKFCSSDHQTLSVVSQQTSRLLCNLFVICLFEIMLLLFGLLLQLSKTSLPPRHGVWHPFLGLVERVNGMVKVRVSKLMADHGQNWDETLHDITFSINSQPQSSTKFSPFFLMFGREAYTLMEVSV